MERTVNIREASNGFVIDCQRRVEIPPSAEDGPSNHRWDMETYVARSPDEAIKRASDFLGVLDAKPKRPRASKARKR